MQQILAALAFTTMALAINADTIHAEVTYPWCAHNGTRGGAKNCGFSTWGQCRAAVSGNGGYCERNPMFHPGLEHPVAPSKSRGGWANRQSFLPRATTRGTAKKE
jgi:Protein of unknown function (DUF3551)